ncbi:hypothetical protein K461DRAFT_51229 [Myriangium duriaei CBS 260.36]|uniref:Uncharacterized protein n=1 Tax=Myriangium duriaei CBS 260.36 TaxID=1168546 RepID=A0A9P4IXI5_9PEZI|nr:hypothetical protein K461DRAFT_51229 [Myriangium duriaei CBS 260.36]
MSLIMDPVPPFFNSPSSSSSHTHMHTLQRPYSTTTSTTSAPHIHSNLHQSVFAAQNRGVHKTVPSQSKLPSSINHANRLESILPEQIRNQLPLSPSRSVHTSWSSPRNSPRPNAFFEASAPAPQRQASTSSVSSNWIVPTPPHSESGSSNIAVDSRAQSFASASPQPSAAFVSSNPAVMSVNYGLPAQFGPLGIDDSTLQSQNYSLDHGFRQSIPQHPTSQAYAYSQATAIGATGVRTSSPVPLQSQYGEPSCVHLRSLQRLGLLIVGICQAGASTRVCQAGTSAGGIEVQLAG